jgi:phosphinothricin acetyltransferase
MAAVAEIIAHHILAGWAHFAAEPQSEAEWTADWQANHERYPWLVAEPDEIVAERAGNVAERAGNVAERAGNVAERAGNVAGLAYAKSFNPRAAYEWTAEVSVYLRDGCQGQGIGSLLYGHLVPLLDAQGYRCLVAGITTPNEASVRLHERFGFVRIGTLERVGYKHGAWRDVGSWQRLTGPPDDTPPPPIRAVSEVWRD